MSTLHSDTCGDGGGANDNHGGQEESPRRPPPGWSPCPTAKRPLRETAEAPTPLRLTVVWGWRTLGRQMLAIQAADTRGAWLCLAGSRFDLQALRIFKEIFLHIPQEIFRRF